VGGIAVALLLGTYALLGLPVSVPLLVAGFCGAAFVYGADRGLVAAPEDALSHPRRRQWVRTHTRWLRGEVTGLLLVGAAALPFLNATTLIGVGAAGLLAGLHVLPMGRWGRPLKSMGLGKPLVVAAAWALGATVLPVLEAGRPVTPEVGGLAGYRLLFILPNVLLADWGDRDGDAAAGLRTWTRSGMGPGLRWGATGLLGLAGGLAAVLACTSVPAGLLLVDALGLAWMLGAVWGAAPARPRHRLVLDLLVAWPLVTALVAWSLG
jgi:4-hydroxybenzoate polyprenyltransferase